MATKSWERSLVTNQTPPKLMVGEDSVTANMGRAVAVNSDGRMMTADVITVANVATTARAGVIGRLNENVTFTIDTGMTATVHPLVHGVSIVFNTAAAAAVAAVGKVVTLTAKNAPALTDITAMNVLIAASPTVSVLIGPLAGTGTDTFDAALSIAETALWRDGTIPANLMCVSGSDGYVWPAEEDATGGIKTSDSSIHAGEDLANKVQVVEGRWALGSGGILAASGTAHNAACRVACLIASETGGANPITVYLRDGGAGGAIMTPTIAVPLSQSREVWFDLPFGTDVYATIGGAGTASVAVYRHVGGP